MKKLVFLIICIVFPSVCFAEDIFISQTVQGGDSGITCSNAHSATWFNSAGNWANPKQIGKIGPGDTVHICGIITSQLTTKTDGNNGSVVTILFEKDAKFSTTTWGANTGAITIQNSYITLDGGANGIIEATDNGTTAVFGGTKVSNSNIYGVLINNASNIEVKNLTIRNIYDRLADSNDCIKAGRALEVSGTSNNIIINNNKLSDAVLVLSVILNNSDNITISNNTIRDSGVGINVAPGNDTVHGSNINIFGNDIRGNNKFNGAWGAECIANGCASSCNTDLWFHQDGMHLFSRSTASSGYVDTVNVYNNYLQDFGTHSTAHIYIEYQYMKNVLIYNNVLVNTGTNYAANGMITVKSASNVKIYNNTLVGAGTSNNIGIYWNASGGILSQNGDIKNNIISSVRTAMGWAVGTTWSADYNVIYNVSPSYTFQDSSNTWYTLSWWTGSGYDAHGLTVNPQLSDSYKLTSSSPSIVKSGGENLSIIFNIDKAGMPRPTTGGWSIGAYENKRPNPPLLLDQ